MIRGVVLGCGVAYWRGSVPNIHRQGGYRLVLADHGHSSNVYIHRVVGFGGRGRYIIEAVGIPDLHLHVRKDLGAGCFTGAHS